MHLLIQRRTRKARASLAAARLSSSSLRTHWQPPRRTRNAPRRVNPPPGARIHVHNRLPKPFLLPSARARTRDQMARPLLWQLALILAVLCSCAPEAADARPPSLATSGRDLLQTCSITNCIRCRNERISSFTPTEVCISCDSGYTPAADRLSCGELL